jgi:hypothetical protein
MRSRTVLRTFRVSLLAKEWVFFIKLPILFKYVLAKIRIIFQTPTSDIIIYVKGKAGGNNATTALAYS